MQPGLTEGADAHVSDTVIRGVVDVDQVVGRRLVETRVPYLQAPSSVDAYFRRSVVFVLYVVTCKETTPGAETLHQCRQ